MNEYRYYAWREPEGLEGLIRVEWTQEPHEPHAYPQTLWFWKDSDWIESPSLAQHFIPGLLNGPEHRSDPVVEVEEEYREQVMTGGR